MCEEEMLIVSQSLRMYEIVASVCVQELLRIEKENLPTKYFALDNDGAYNG